MAKAPWLARSSKVIVADLYDPMHLEQLEQTRGQDLGRRGSDVASTTNALNDQLLRGDFFLCASEKQRLASMFATERAELEKRWAGGHQVNTEDLRQGLRRYRSFFERLLAA